MICPQCGVSCEAHHKFCHQCGTPLPEYPNAEAEPVIDLPAQVAAADAAPVTEPISEDPDLPETENKCEAAEKSHCEEDPAAKEPPLTAAPPPTPPQKKGRLWPPFLIMIIMAAIGLGMFFITEHMEPKQDGWFTVQNGALSFDESLYTGSEELTVPEVVHGQTVTALAPGCFAGCEKLTTVKLPDTIKTIGSEAFAGCTALRGLQLPDHLESIGRYAFYGCTALEAIVISDSVTSIAEGTFNGCTGLRYIIYSGTYNQWKNLYSEFINAFVMVNSTDGYFFHKRTP